MLFSLRLPVSIPAPRNGDSSNRSNSRGSLSVNDLKKASFSSASRAASPRRVSTSDSVHSQPPDHGVISDRIEKDLPKMNLAIKRDPVDNPAIHHGPETHNPELNKKGKQVETPEKPVAQSTGLKKKSKIDFPCTFFVPTGATRIDKVAMVRNIEELICVLREAAQKYEFKVPSAGAEDGITDAMFRRPIIADAGRKLSDSTLFFNYAKRLSLASQDSKSVATSPLAVENTDEYFDSGTLTQQRTGIPVDKANEGGSVDKRRRFALANIFSTNESGGTLQAPDEVNQKLALHPSNESRRGSSVNLTGMPAILEDLPSGPRGPEDSPGKE